MRNTILFIAVCLLLPVVCPAQSSLAKKFNARPELIYSGVKVDSVLSNQQKEDLFVLGRLWGFLKYYHPEVAKGSYSFDSCLFTILPRY
jgi:hypothetical protein